MAANTQPQVTLASDESMTVVALNHAAMCELVKSWPKLQPRPVLPPFAEQVAALDAILTAQREASLAKVQALKAAAMEAGDRELAHACRIALARAENNREKAA